MGFSLKAWSAKALKSVGSEFRKINVGKALSKALHNTVGNFERGVSGNLAAVGDTVRNVNEGATAAKRLPYIIGGAAVLIALVMWYRRR